MVGTKLQDLRWFQWNRVREQMIESLVVHIQNNSKVGM